jgi:hypothetical protein
MKICKALSAALLFAAANLACAAPLMNGGFETGTADGWITGGGDRSSVLNAGLSPASFLPGGSLYQGPSPRSSTVSAGTLDPNLGTLLGSTVYSGKYSFRSEDTGSGGYASALSQKVLNYTDTDIFFAWKAVLQNGGHTDDESAEMIITLTDDTTGTLLISRIYNAGDGGGGVDTRFSESGDVFYTANWQIEQLSIDASLSGHDFTLSLLVADCEPTGHYGYMYIDGFGNQTPPPVDVPEPASAALMLLGAGGFLASRRRRNKR